MAKKLVGITRLIGKLIVAKIHKVTMNSNGEIGMTEEAYRALWPKTVTYPQAVNYETPF